MKPGAKYAAEKVSGFGSGSASKNICVFWRLVVSRGFVGRFELRNWGLVIDNVGWIMNNQWCCPGGGIGRRASLRG